MIISHIIIRYIPPVNELIKIGWNLAWLSSKLDGLTILSTTTWFYFSCVDTVVGRDGEGVEQSTRSKRLQLCLNILLLGDRDLSGVTAELIELRLHVPLDIE